MTLSPTAREALEKAWREHPHSPPGFGPINIYEDGFRAGMDFQRSEDDEAAIDSITAMRDERDEALSIIESLMDAYHLRVVRSEYGPQKQAVLDGEKVLRKHGRLQ